MTKHPFRTLLLLALAAALIAGGWYLNRPQAIEVRLAKVETGKVESIVANTRAGTVKPCRRARLAPEVGGQIALLKVHEGLRVRTGDLLLALWNQDLVARVALAEREADAARSKAEAGCFKSAQAQCESMR